VATVLSKWKALLNWKAVFLRMTKLIQDIESQTAKDFRACECEKFIVSVQDAMYALGGKWKLPILVTLTPGSKRFSEISGHLNGITDKVLSKELKELELNHLIRKTIHETFPLKTEYTITEHGLSLEGVLQSLKKWGDAHRKKVFEM
jgi:DNA-binding HxlR family transcriptional regulator